MSGVRTIRLRLSLSDMERRSHPMMKKLNAEELAWLLKDLFRDARTVAVEQCVHSASFNVILTGQVTEKP